MSEEFDARRWSEGTEASSSGARLGARVLSSGRCIGVVLAIAASAGCSNFIPKDGPVGSDIAGSASTVLAATPNSIGYALVDINPVILAGANSVTDSSEPRLDRLASGPGPDVSIGVGDLLNVTIFEADAGGLFIPKDAGSRSGNFISLPNQQVNAAGTINIPYIDKPIRVLGRSMQSVSKEISSRLAGRAIEPQVVISVAEHRGNDVNVLGEVNQPVRFSIDPGGIPILGAIARAGGPKNPAYETIVSLQRNGIIQRERLSGIVKNPSENYFMRPNDVLYLSREPRYYVVLGATPSPGAVGGINNRRFTFENDHMQLSEALGKAGGLDSARANPREVFLFRTEPRRMLAAAGVDVTNFPAERVPTIYKLNLSQGAGFFLANSFQIRDKDLLFVTDAPETDLLKFLQVITVASGVAYNGANAAAAAN